MALAYPCPQCGKVIEVKFLKVGELAQCRNCSAKSYVPEWARWPWDAENSKPNPAVLALLEEIGGARIHCQRVIAHAVLIGQDASRSVGNLFVCPQGIVYLPYGSYIQPESSVQVAGLLLGVVGAVAAGLLELEPTEEAAETRTQALGALVRLRGVTLRERVLRRGNDPGVLIVPRGRVTKIAGGKAVGIFWNEPAHESPIAIEHKAVFLVPGPVEVAYLQAWLAGTAADSPDEYEVNGE